MRTFIHALAAVACIAAGLSCPGAASAQAPPSRTPVRRLTLADAVRLALARSPDSRTADQDVASARGGLTQAKVIPNPDVFVAANDRNIKPTDAPVPNQYGFDWTFPIGGRRAAGIAVARSDLSSARASRAATRRRLALDVVTAFVDLELDRSLLDFARQDQQAFKESVQINEVRYQDGKISFGEVLKLRIQARQVDDTVREAEQAVVSDRAELRRLVGGDALAPDYRVAGSLAPPAMPADLEVDDVVAKALEKRPEQRSLKAQLDSARHALALARRQAVPDLGVTADYNRIPHAGDTYDLQLVMIVPLFDRNQGNVEAARADVKKAQLSLDAFRDQVRADVTRVLEQLRIAEQRLQSYSDDFVKTAKQSLDISRHSYDEGRGSILDYLDAESSYRDVERAYLSAQAEALIAVANLKFVIGEKLP